MSRHPIDSLRKVSEALKKSLETNPPNSADAAKDAARRLEDGR